MGSEWILGRLAWGVLIGFDWLRTETGDEPLGSCGTELVSIVCTRIIIRHKLRVDRVKKIFIF
jgi:hypothetical protein